MTSYLTPEQYALLMDPRGIHPKRVSARDGMSYVEAYDIKAETIRVYGWCRFDWEIVSERVQYEQQVKTNAGKDAWKVVAVVHGMLTVKAPDGTELAHYDGVHAGSSVHPDYGEALGNAITNADSYAYKRAAVFALGTQGGLGLYNKGSREEIVRWTMVKPEGQAATQPDHDDVPEVHPEDETTEPTPDPRETTPPVAPPPAVEAATPRAVELRDALLGPLPEGQSEQAYRMRLMACVRAEKLAACQVVDVNGELTTLGALATRIVTPLAWNSPPSPPTGRSSKPQGGRRAG